MTQFQTFKQNNYLPNLKHINNLISPKNQQHLQKFITPNSYKILITLINQLKTNMETQPKKYQRFYQSILLTNNFAKNTLGLSYHQLQNALTILEDFELIQINYYQSPLNQYKSRTITLNLSNFQYFNLLLNNFKQFISNTNYTYGKFLKSLYKYNRTLHPERYQPLDDIEDEPIDDYYLDDEEEF